MKIKDIMTRHVECLNPSDSLARAAQRMRDLDVGSLPICDSDRLAGIITDRDIAIRGVAFGCNADTTRVDEIMTPHIAFCFEDDSVDDAAQVMEDQQIRRLAVLNRAKRLVGIISLGDLAIRSGDMHMSAEALEQISEPIGTG